jgi:photosystem II stability/assembly factor-like uncharacterized protein
MIRERSTRRWWVVQVATLLVAAGVTALAFLTRGVDPPGVVPPGPSVQGLPTTPDYHSLLVSQGDSRRILLGTHDGVYESVDGGKTWQQTTLVAEDAMTLEPAQGSLVWAAGHGVLALSEDSGGTWEAVRPEGLPSLDIHSFAIDPTDRRSVYAAVAGEGLYHSGDGGSTFSLVSDEFGGDFTALEVGRNGEMLAGDAEKGLLLSSDRGRSWEPLGERALSGLAFHPVDPKIVLVGGPGLLLSGDGGRSFRQVLHVEPGVGPVAWAPSDVDVGYAVGFNRILYHTNDGGETWEAVA